jgi:hypothetical protein
MDICRQQAPPDIYVDDVLVKCFKYSDGEGQQS